jgi:hypothetical protein
VRSESVRAERDVTVVKMRDERVSERSDTISPEGAQALARGIALGKIDKKEF